MNKLVYPIATLASIVALTLLSAACATQPHVYNGARLPAPGPHPAQVAEEQAPAAPTRTEAIARPATTAR